MTTPPVLSDRALNRATLERQLLLERRRGLGAAEAVSWLVGLQAQEPWDPYLALWSRIEGFSPEELGDALESRSVVRIVVMRGTIHLVTADDALGLRPLMQPVLDGELSRHPDVKLLPAGFDIGPALALGRSLLDERPRTQAELRTAFEASFPSVHAPGLAYACRCHLPLVQVPPRAVWGKRGVVRLAHLETWLGRSLADGDVAAPTIDDVVVRYLRSFGPASAQDVATWTRLTGLRAVVERLRPSLRVFRDERGRELFDVVDGPLPSPDVDAPVRFLPQYDNVLLSHHDRSRFFLGDERSRLGQVNVPTVHGTVLHDGFVCATWRWDGDDLVVDALDRVTARQWKPIEAEGMRVLGLFGRDGDVRRGGPAG